MSECQPCPICGNKNTCVIKNSINFYSGFCKQCELRGPTKATHNMALHEWNKLTTYGHKNYYQGKEILHFEYVKVADYDKPCPTCGCDNNVIICKTLKNFYFILCNDCECMTYQFTDIRNAIEQWEDMYNLDYLKNDNKKEEEIVEYDRQKESIEIWKDIITKMDKDNMSDNNENVPEIKDCVCGRAGWKIKWMRTFGVGSKPEDNYDSNYLWCPDCNRQTMYYETKKEAIEAWNDGRIYINKDNEKQDNNLDMPEIKPCPYCGSKEMQIVSNINYGFWFHVICNKCKASGAVEQDKESAILIWNQVSNYVHDAQADKNLKDL